MVYSHLFVARTSPAQIVPLRPAPPPPSTISPAAYAHAMPPLPPMGVSAGSQQVTPPVEPPPVKPRQAVKVTTPKAQQPVVKFTTPKAQFPRKLGWDVPRIVDALKAFQQDIKDQHAQLTAYLIDSTSTTERRVRTGNDLFAGMKATLSETRTDVSMGAKFKVGEYPLSSENLANISHSITNSTPNSKKRLARDDMKPRGSKLMKSAFHGTDFTTWK